MVVFVRFCLFFGACCRFIFAVDLPGQLAEKDGTYLGEYPFVSISRLVSPSSFRARTVVLPINRDQGNLFAEAAHRQISEFFRANNYLVPSLLETNAYLRQNEFVESDYEKKFAKMALDFKAKYVVYLEVKRLSHTTKVNPAGVLAAGVLVSGVARYATAEYQLRVYRVVEKNVETFSAYEQKKDYLLGFWQSSKKMALKLQEETLSALLNSFSQREIKRSEGYILEPIRTFFPDSKGFQ